jgi:negative regulator of flagellin synthesis FlgM
MKVTGKSPSQPQPMGNTETAKGGKISGKESIGADKSSATSGASALQKSDSARVELSTRAQDIRKAKELATPSNDVDEAKVARLQKLIDEGKYKVDAEAIADRLLDEQMKMN